LDRRAARIAAPAGIVWPGSPELLPRALEDRHGRGQEKARHRPGLGARADGPCRGRARGRPRALTAEEARLRARAVQDAAKADAESRRLHALEEEDRRRREEEQAAEEARRRAE